MVTVFHEDADGTDLVAHCATDISEQAIDALDYAERIVGLRAGRLVAFQVSDKGSPGSLLQNEIVRHQKKYPDTTNGKWVAFKWDDGRVACEFVESGTLPSESA